MEVTRQTMKINTYLEQQGTTIKALIDSGAGGNFIHERTAYNLQLPRIKLWKPVKVRNVDGTNNTNGLIEERTILWTTIASRSHQVSFLIGGIGDQEVILGLPWLIRENPDINWKRGTLQWRPEYIDLNHPRHWKGYFETPADELTIRLYRAKLSETFNLMYGPKEEIKKKIEDQVPKQYHEYLDVFSKKKSERFPQERPYDHEINLKEDFKPKRIPPYSLNQQELKLAKEFVDENLEKGYIRPSKSDMASPLFFVGKKDGTKRPCQDYRLLNEGTIKDAYPIPKITDLLRVLQKAKYFTKLDIRWGYNNVLIKEKDRHKAAFSTPFGLYEPNVMFFGLCNSPATFQ
jgi:Reverse transcriptase (RNA-dependent DNA polymerase)/gag-polyprotein putative aspartyl protease